MSQIQIIEYSTRSIVVSGDTKSIKTDLMKLGGKWNSKLKSSPGKGWVFPKTKKHEVEKFLDSGDTVKINDESITLQEQIEKLTSAYSSLKEENERNVKALSSQKEEYARNIDRLEKIISEKDKTIQKKEDQLSHFARIYDDLMQEYTALCEPDEEVPQEVQEEEVPQEVPQEVPEEVPEEDLESEIKSKIDELSKMKLKEIKKIPEYKRIKGRSKMNKYDLIDELINIYFQKV